MIIPILYFLDLDLGLILEYLYKIQEFVDKIQEFLDKIQEFVDKILEFLSGFGPF
jgi:uncharacterized alkaline shock family protein YloU